MNTYFNVFKNTFDLKGRSMRCEFWIFIIVNCLFFFILTFIWYFFTKDSEYPVLEIINTILGIIVLVPTFSLSIRRLHDTGRNAWWLTIVLFPIIGQIAFLIMMMQDSQIGYNHYGEYPKFCGNL